MLSSISSRKVLGIACVIICLCVIVLTFSQRSSLIATCLLSSTGDTSNKEVTTMVVEKVDRKDYVNNSGAVVFLAEYEAAFNKKKVKPVVEPDPNKPETITNWWQAAAMMDWYFHGPIRYNCKDKVAMGNWHICQDEPYTIKPPCLVYSFGINWDYSFDDAMVKLGCEVHSFDPSMGLNDHKRENNSTFHNLGIGSANTDGFVARQDIYVKGRSVWKIRTVKAIMKMLGHENRVIDVFKMDVETYEWGILDNMMESGVLKHIRQFPMEFHLFYNCPLFEEYIYIYKILTRFREMGFQEFAVAPHTRNMDEAKFNNQADTEFINAFFEKQKDWE